MTPNTTTQAVQSVPKEDKEVTFVPFGAADKVRLSIAIVRNMVAVPTKTGKLPNDRECGRFMMLCSAQRLNPFAGDAFLIGYEPKDATKPISWSLITAHVAFLKRAESCVDYEGMESGLILGLKEDGTISEAEGDFYLPERHDVLGGWAKVFRKGRKPTYRRVRMERFNKGYGEWLNDAAGMICKCAEADALRSTFPSLLGGLYQGAEILDVVSSVVPVNSGLLTASPVVTQEAREETAPSEPARQELAPASKAANGAVTQSPQLALKSAVESAGFSFDEFREAVEKASMLANADALTDWTEISPEDAKRLGGRALKGLIAEMDNAKGLL